MSLKDRKLVLNEQISYEVFNQDWPEHVGSSRERIIHQASPEFGSAGVAAIGSGPTNASWPSANKPVAIPFRVFKGMTVFQLGWINGSGTMTDSCDVGVYDASWNRKVSTGSTARSGSAAIQWVDVTDTFLPVGKYYLASSNNGTTLNNYRAVTALVTVGFCAGMGVFDSATNAFPLPDPLTNMVAAATFTGYPQLLIAARVPF